jgi:crotonobetainyl-CoA:carnitine CoA-transferase CaiB-like acyl-CoA transferase
MRIQDVPKFGCLSGVKVVLNATNIACPFAASLMAENGATVIFVESSLTPDTGRVNEPPYLVPQERRNMLGINLNILSPEGRDVFIKLIKESDILFEGNKGGTYSKWGLSDEVLWGYNPKLVIVHVSGFGQSGVQEYVTRPCYDAIGQAFGGYTFQNGVPGGEAIKAGQYAGDYLTSLFGCWSALAAYINAQNTGKGDSIDLAMYEAMWKVQANVGIEYFKDGIIETRCGITIQTLFARVIFFAKTANMLSFHLLDKPLWPMF